MPLGGVITAAVLWPNIIFVLFPPPSLPSSTAKLQTQLGRAMSLVERAGQIASFVIPFFHEVRIESSQEAAGLAGMMLALGLYYLGWARYVLRGRAYRFLYAPLLGIPLPMALAPVAYFFLASVVLRAPLLVVAAAVLGVGHFYVSQGEWERVTAVEGKGQST